MEHIAAILLIVGCSSDLSQCRELPSPVTVFEAAEECNQAWPFAIEDLAGSSPRIFGKCIEIDPALEEEAGEIIWQVTPDDGLEASIQPSAPAPSETLVASSEPHPQKGHDRKK